MIEPPLMFTVEPLVIPGGKCRATASSERLVFNMLDDENPVRMAVTE